MNKVARVTVVFWATKICATMLGGTAGDLFSMTPGIGYAVGSIVVVGMFLAALAMQLRSRAFHPSVYWIVVLLTSTVGTALKDFMDRTLGLGYATGSAILVALLALVLFIWRMVEKSLSVSHIESRRAEAFYWAAILCSNSLGTALGDFLADESGLGLLGSAALIGCLLAQIVAACRFTNVSRVALFWIAFVLTHPLGDVLSKSAQALGPKLGTVGSSAVLATILLVLVVRARRVHPATTALVEFDQGDATPGSPGFEVG